MIRNLILFKLLKIKDDTVKKNNINNFRNKIIYILEIILLINRIKSNTCILVEEIMT